LVSESIKDLIEVNTNITRRARTIIAGKADALKEAVRIVLLAEEAIAKTKTA